MALQSPADVLVVGGGSAGCALAARLAASAGSRSVLLVEAGPDLRAAPPALMHDGWRTYRDSDWGLQSEPDDHGEVEPLFRGKVVGGSAWMTRFAMRGSPADFDEWARLGNPGWAFDDVLPALRRLEDDLDFGGETWHGQAGPIAVTRYPDIEQSPFESAVAAACSAAGIPVIDDHNRPGAEGAARMPRSSRDGTRVTSADGYLPVGATPPNLTIRSNAQVAAVMVDHGDAVGVRLVDGTEVHAGWVVLCAGTYGSPAILLRSGIGPPTTSGPWASTSAQRCQAWAPTSPTTRASTCSPATGGRVSRRGSSGWQRSAPRPRRATSRPTSPCGSRSRSARATTRPRPTSPLCYSHHGPEGSYACAAPTRWRRPRSPCRFGHPADVERLAEAALRAHEVAGHAAVRRLCEGSATALPADDQEVRAMVHAQAWSFRTSSAPAAWARPPTTAPWSTPGATCTGCGDSVSPTRRSSRRRRQGSRT